MTLHCFVLQVADQSPCLGWELQGQGAGSVHCCSFVASESAEPYLQGDEWVWTEHSSWH